jgi:hypothetical protein
LHLRREPTEALLRARGTSRCSIVADLEHDLTDRVLDVEPREVRGEAAEHALGRHGARHLGVVADELDDERSVTLDVVRVRELLDERGVREQRRDGRLVARVALDEVREANRRGVLDVGEQLGLR